MASLRVLSSGGPGRDMIRLRRIAATLLAATLITALAFLTTGGFLDGPPTQLPSTWTDVVLILGGGVALGSLIVLRLSGAGRLSLGLFAALAVLSILSILWSVAPDQSWEESGRTVAYLASFTIALVLARRWAGPLGSRPAVLALTLGLEALCLWALAVKVFALNLGGQPQYGPLLAPFGYWNATAAVAAMALPGSLHLAADRRAGALTRGLATAGVTIAASVVVLTYSRSAVAGAGLALVVCLVAFRHRRRAVLALGLGLLGAVPIGIEAISTYDISADTAHSLYGASGTAPVHRAGAGLVLGAVVLASALLVVVLGILLARWLDARPQPQRRIARFDRGLLAAACAVPVLAVLYLLLNRRGPGGEISHLWSSLVSASGYSASGGAGRLTGLANSRAVYWRQALAVGEHHLLVGSGVGTFDPAYLRYPSALLAAASQQNQAQAHSYVLDIFATLGLLGIAVVLALFCAWWREAWSAVHRPPGASRGELDARWALIGVVVAFGVSSALDWTWYLPGVAVPAMLAAGWIAGSGVGSVVPEQAAVPLGRRPGAIAALTCVALVTLGAAWESLGPLRSNESAEASINALAAENAGAALDDAQAAVRQDPLSATAREQLASVYGALGHPSRELAELVRATEVQPDNPQPFAVVGGYLLCRRNAVSRDDYVAARPFLRRSVTLDVTNASQQIAMLGDADSFQHPNGIFCAHQF